MPMLRVAFICLHPHKCDDFFSEMPFCRCSGELRAAGHFSQVLVLYLNRDDSSETRSLLDGLVRHLADGRFDVVVLDQVWTPGLLAEIKQQTGAVVISTDLHARHPGEVDFLLGHLGGNRPALTRLVECVAQKGDPSLLPNVWLQRGGRLMPGRAPRQPCWPGPEPPFVPDLDPVYLNPDFRPPVLRHTLTPNSGCPHALPVPDNPFFAGVPLDAELVSARGCSFCHQGGDYQGRPGPDSAALVLDWIQVILKRQPQVRELILRDQSCLRYLPALVRGAMQRGLSPLSLLLSARADHVVRFRGRLEQALQAMSGSGHQLELYLIGFESLSQRMLDLYNKGMTVEDCLEAVRTVRDLGRRYPESFVCGRYRTSSFILFNPWVTLDDLQQNIRHIEEHRITDLAAGIPLTKLRLYPNLPLYHKASRERLLIDAYGDPHLDGAAAAGYSAEHPWRFEDPRCSLVYQLVSRLHRRLPQDREIGLLQHAVDLARGLSLPLLQPGPAAGRIEELETALAARLGLDRPGDRLEARAVAAAEPAADLPGDDAIRVEDHEQRSESTINISTVCNQRCIFCAGYSLAPVSEEEILSHIRGREEVVFQGGEPTLNRSLLRYARFAREQGVRTVTLATNGLRLAYLPYARACLEAGIDRFFFALPSHIRKKSDLLSRVPGSFKLKIRGLQNLVQLGAGGRVRLIHLLCRHNHEDLPGYVRFLRQELPEIRSLEIKLMQCLGNVEDNRELIPSFDQLRPPLLQALLLLQQEGMAVVVNGIPPCILPDHHTLCMSYHMKCVTGSRVTGRRFLPQCEGCPLAFCCLGVRVDYLKIFGPAEIVAARRSLGSGAAPLPAGADRGAPVQRLPLPPRPGSARLSEQELHRSMACSLEQGRPGDALSGLRLLLGIRGCEPSPAQLDAPVPAHRLLQSLTMRGLKPAELTMLRHGLRPVVKLEDLEADEAQRFVADNRHRYRLVCSEPYLKDDLDVDQVPAPQEPETPRLVTLYVSRDEGAQRLKQLDEADPRHTSREAGLLLGYPPCCVEHFVEVSERSHEAGQRINEAVMRSSWQRTPDRHGPLPFETSLFTDRSLLSFYPCSLRCGQAVRWADDVLQAMAADDPQMAEACRRDCARPVLFFRLPFFFIFEGTVEGQSLLYRGFAVNTYGSARTRRIQELFYRDIGRLLEAGDRLTVTDRELAIARGDRLVARLAKEDPGACLLLGFSA